MPSGPIPGQAWHKWLRTQVQVPVRSTGTTWLMASRCVVPWDEWAHSSGALWLLYEPRKHLEAFPGPQALFAQRSNTRPCMAQVAPGTGSSPSGVHWNDLAYGVQVCGALERAGALLWGAVTPLRASKTSRGLPRTAGTLCPAVQYLARHGTSGSGHRFKSQ